MAYELSVPCNFLTISMETAVVKALKMAKKFGGKFKFKYNPKTDKVESTRIIYIG